METLLLELKRLGIGIGIQGDNLKLSLPQDINAKEILAQVKEHKEALLDFLHKKEREQSLEVVLAKAEEKPYYPLSPAQKRLFFLHQLAPSSLQYNMPQIIELKGRLDLKKLNGTLDYLVRRHESLRTSFGFINGEPVQFVHEALKWEILPVPHEGKTVKELAQDFVQPFNLQSKTMMRTALVKLKRTHHLLLIDFHHMIMDGVSLNILIREFSKIYQGESLPPQKLQYKDYAVWRQGVDLEPKYERDRTFWLQEFKEESENTDLPLDFKRGSRRSHKGGYYSFELDGYTTEKLKAVAREFEVSIFMLLLACYNVVLAHLCNSEDITIGTVLSGRQQKGVENIVGMFANTLPIRNFPMGQLSFKDFLLQVKNKVLSCFEHQNYSYETLINELRLERSLSRNTLFDSVFIFQNFEQNKFKLQDLKFRKMEQRTSTAKFDLTLIGREHNSGISLSLEYALDLFKPKTIRRIATYFAQVISAVLSDTSLKLSDIEVLDKKEKELLRKTGVAPTLSYNQKDTVVAMFEKRCKESPNDIAIVDGERQLSYRALEALAAMLAKKITDSLGKEKGHLIGILAEPSADMIIGILAVAKIGGVFVPLSPQHPRSRNSYIIEDCQAQLVLLQHSLHQEANFVKLPKLPIPKKSAEEFQEVGGGSVVINPDDSLYIIYTSGTTGRPKGVEVANRGVSNMVENFKTLFQLSTMCRMSQVADFSFDAAMYEIWPNLIYGGPMFIAPWEAKKDPRQMKKWLADNRIEVSWQPTAFAETLLKESWDESTSSLRIMTTAGDTLRYVPRNQMPFKLYNLYGPTEDTVWTTWVEIKTGKAQAYYSIGKPIANKKVYILNEHASLVPFGVKGELCISGPGLAKGYVNNKILSGEKFIANPFEKNTFLYRTGDIVRWREGGDLEFFGRKDSQVKIRGYRIELGEVEQELLRHPVIQSCVIILGGSGSSTQLAAYYVASKAIGGKELQTFLSDRLPKYMIPSTYVQLKTIPYTVNGKLDKQSLPDPVPVKNNNFTPPKNKTEKELANIWAKILGLGNELLDVHTNFFDLGGNSINMIELNQNVNQFFGKQLSVAEMFHLSTIRALATYLKNEGAVASFRKEVTQKATEEAKDRIKLLPNL